MRYLILLKQTETGFAIMTVSETLAGARAAAREAIRINLEAYRESGQPLPEKQPVHRHIEDPAFQDYLFAYVDVPAPKGIRAA